MMNDLEFLREAFKDPRLHVGIGNITQLGLSQDGSILRATVNLMPENREVVGEVTFSDVNCVTFPEIDDLALCVFVDGHPDEAYIIKTVNNSDESIPVFAQTGNTMIAPREGMLVGVGRSGVAPTSPFVLGDILVSYFNALLTQLNNIITQLNTVPTVICTAPGVLGEVNPALVTALTTIKTQIQTDQETYLATAESNILSQLAFTERGV